LANRMEGDPQLNLELGSPQAPGISHPEPDATVGYDTAKDGTAGGTCYDTAEDGTSEGICYDTTEDGTAEGIAAEDEWAGTTPHRPARTTFLVGRVTPGSGQIMMGGFPSPPFPGPWTLRALIRTPRLLLWPPSDIVH
jgi:hypothetical protein